MTCHDLTFRRLHQFWGAVLIGDDCWLWTGRLSENGYGTFRWPGVGYLAHRIAFILFHGSILPGVEVCHSCDNPRCVNPSHLFVGTHSDNMHDKYIKGRCRCTSGELNRHARLDRVQIAEIRRKYEPYQTTYAMLAFEYGVSLQQIHRIVTGQRWAHVAGAQSGPRRR